MSVFLYKFRMFLEIFLFVISVGLLAYLSQNNKWKYFTITLVVSAILFLILKLLDSAHIKKWLEERERQANRIVDKFNLFGTSNFYNMQSTIDQEERNKKTREIIGEGNYLSLMSLSAASYLDPAIQRHWNILKKRVDDGAILRILLLDPTSKDKKTRDLLNEVSTDVDRKFPIDQLTKLKKNYPNIEIRLTDNCLYCALFFSETEMIYDPYHMGKVGDRIENHFIALNFKKHDPTVHGTSYFALLKNHFEYNWINAKKLEEVLQ